MLKFSLLVVFVSCFHNGLGTRVSFDNGNFNVSWTYNRDADELYFEVDAKATGWIGFGFTHTPKNMSNYDIVIGGQTSAGQSYFNDFFSSGIGTPQLDSKQSYTLDWATEENGITSLRFYRPRNTRDPQDIHFNDSTRAFLVWAYHDVDDASNPRMFSMHTRRSHTRESQQIIPVINPTISTTRLKPETTTHRDVLTRKPKSSAGFQLGAGFITISISTILCILVA